ncbi:hypothetical protein CCH79_00003992 [Gambusia affinis]|uniref:Uncharacterized protein n=1 Tax=Gambusia affinis TaxID=33528 RepID=A0A315V4B6_GAMAF|nr:hypothetical protein CCH79_00003992 [Gambusia affinis]
MVDMWNSCPSIVPEKAGVPIATITPYSPYWVLTTDYTSLAVVFSCTDILRLFRFEYAWILSRSRFPPPLTVHYAKELLSNFALLFQTVSHEESAIESQPVPNIDHLLTNIGRTGTSQGDVSGQVGGVYHAVMSLMDSVMNSWNCRKEEDCCRHCSCLVCRNPQLHASACAASALSAVKLHGDSNDVHPATMPLMLLFLSLIGASLEQGSWGSGKDQCSRDLLVSSIFAAASRKRGRSREKPQPSSSDDDLDSVFPRKEVPSGQRPNHHPLQGDKLRAEERKENGRTIHRNSLFQKEKTPPRRASPSPIISDQTAAQRKISLSDPLSQLEENTSDLGTMSSGASVPRSRPKKWTGGAFLDLPASAGAEVSSITSDYSTTSSITFLTGAESGVLSPELHGGEEADDERSELISEGRPMETDSEGEFPVFAPGGGSGQSTPRPTQSQEKPIAGAQKQEARRLFPTQRMIECDTLSRRWSLRHKTDSDSSAEGAVGTEGRAESSSRLSRVLEVMKKGRSSSSISSSSRSESERPEPAWHLKITERLRFRIRSSADDMFTTKSQTPDARSKKKNIRRRHTMGGQRDFANLAVINDWREQGGVDQTADLSALDRLKPKCSSQDLSVRDWITHERLRGSEPSAEVAPKAEPEDDHPEPPEKPPPVTAEQVNGGGMRDTNKTAPTSDAHPHKLSGAQVTRSRFYQYL